jgi:hypothetical protein
MRVDEGGKAIKKKGGEGILERKRIGPMDKEESPKDTSAYIHRVGQDAEGCTNCLITRHILQQISACHVKIKAGNPSSDLHVQLTIKALGIYKGTEQPRRNSKKDTWL